MLTRTAYAKINLALEVVGRRDDGYHDIVSVMQLVDLCDTLNFEDDDTGEITLTCDNPVLAAQGKSNLVWRAARLLQETSKTTNGARIDLRKSIPLAAGLGGGSSDAAAALLGLCDLWDLKLSPSELRNLALMLGSDVPFFLDGPAALVEGRGDRITPVPPPSGWAVLVCQPFHVENKTERLYGTLGRADFSNGIITRQLAASLRRGEFPMVSLLYNTFERAAYRVFDALDEVRQKVVQAGGDDVRLSGSGPTLYVLFSGTQEQDARTLHERLQASGLRTFLVRLVSET